MVGTTVFEPADEINEIKLNDEKERETKIINDNKISALINNDFLLFKDDRIEKYTSENIDDLKAIIKSLELKFGKENIKIFVKSDYFKKSVSNSLFNRFQLLIKVLFS